jgi:ubiquinone/menaquinone biosynthesis C-methylase UbiE
MPAVAASRPVDGAPTGWVQASPGRLPFPDGSFQAICCQAGLQFFPDRPAALAEMTRVLAAGGRLAALVWRSIDHSRGWPSSPGRWTTTSARRRARSCERRSACAVPPLTR